MAENASALWLQIHWFSIINSCVTVLLLTGFLATILMRVLKNDFIKYTRDDEGTLLASLPSQDIQRTSLPKCKNAACSLDSHCCLPACLPACMQV